MANARDRATSKRERQREFQLAERIRQVMAVSPEPEMTDEQIARAALILQAAPHEGNATWPTPESEPRPSVNVNASTTSPGSKPRKRKAVAQR